uniref:C3H1-type domain-containing protein n=1 Tax=Kalanchoe fedtschenkoi TaxID=63787 RepID=A0A7N0UNA7_KALFE
MGSYGRNREAGGGSASDPQPLEEPMRKLRLSAYPERPSEVVCRYYMKNGVCGFGASCRFNHPRDAAAAFYMTTNNCKFGASCKFDHPKHDGETKICLNYLGYPLRPGEKECSYFVRTGQCKFGATCKFDHPQPVHSHVSTATLTPGDASAPLPPKSNTQVHPPPTPAPQPYGVITGNWQVPRTPIFLPAPYPCIQGTYGPTFLQPGVFSMPSWGPYPIQMSPVVSPRIQPPIGSGPRYDMSHLSAPASPYAGPYPLIPTAGAFSIIQKEPILSERPDQPECRNYFKYGYCKYGFSCKYRHPSEVNASKPTPPHGTTEPPLRAGVPYCTNYAHQGVCKFGSSCKFNHQTGAGTLSYSPSASSLADLPVAPCPLECSVGTTAPSSSSSEPEIASGSAKESA